MRPELCSRLERSTSLPTLPSVAINVLAICQKDQLDLSQLARTVSNDPALVAKLLKAANSPLFATRVEITSVQQAVGFLGANAVRALVLTFSLSIVKKTGRFPGLDEYWRRSVLSAIAAKEIALLFGLAAEDAFVCALLQDIGILALAGSFGPSYWKVRRLAGGDHDRLAELERETYGEDHAAVGAWLLERWGTPKAIALPVGASHHPEQLLGKGVAELLRMAQAISISGRFADLWSESPDRVREGKSEPGLFTRFSQEVQRYWHAPLTELEPCVDRIIHISHETASLFEVKLGPAERAAVLDCAREALVDVSIRASRELSEIKESIARLESRTEILLAETQIDPLTGVANRGFINAFLEGRFDQAKRGHQMFGVIFADIDRFKAINDTYGHLVGDLVLRSVAKSITKAVRSGDFVGRFGGEEFLIVLPCETEADILAVAERIRAGVSESVHHGENGLPIPVTVSLGCAVRSPEHQSCWELIEEADRSLYAAKRSGRDRVHLHPQAA